MLYYTVLLKFPEDYCMNETKKSRLEVPLKWFLILHLSLVVNSLAGTASKLAGREPFMSVRFLMLYGLVLLITFPEMKPQVCSK